MNIYRLDDDAPKSVPPDFDPVKEFAKPDFDLETRDEVISHAFGNYIVTLGKKIESNLLKEFDIEFRSTNSEGNGLAYRERKKEKL